MNRRSTSAIPTQSAKTGKKVSPTSANTGRTQSKQSGTPNRPAANTAARNNPRNPAEAAARQHAAARQNAAAQQRAAQQRAQANKQAAAGKRANHRAGQRVDPTMHRTSPALNSSGSDIRQIERYLDNLPTSPVRRMSIFRRLFYLMLIGGVAYSGYWTYENKWPAWQGSKKPATSFIPGTPGASSAVTEAGLESIANKIVISQDWNSAYVVCRIADN